MNSEELEQSLKAEFENQISRVVAELKQQVADLDRQAELANADPQSRTQIQTVRNELASEGSERLRAARTELAAQEADSHERLSALKVRLQTALDRLKALKGNAP